MVQLVCTGSSMDRYMEYWVSNERSEAGLKKKRGKRKEGGGKRKEGRGRRKETACLLLLMAASAACND